MDSFLHMHVSQTPQTVSLPWCFQTLWRRYEYVLFCSFMYTLIHLYIYTYIYIYIYPELSNQFLSLGVFRHFGTDTNMYCCIPSCVHWYINVYMRLRNPQSVSLPRCSQTRLPPAAPALICITVCIHLYPSIDSYAFTDVFMYALMHLYVYKSPAFERPNQSRSSCSTSRGSRRSRIHGPARGVPSLLDVVGCKRPWKKNSLISRGIGDFFYLPGKCSPFFGYTRLKVSINPISLIWSTCFDQSSGQPRGNPGKKKGGGARKKKKKTGEFSFQSISQPTTLTRYLFTPKPSCASQSSWYRPAHLHHSHDCGVRVNPHNGNIL